MVTRARHVVVSVDLLLIPGLLYYARFGREWSLGFELRASEICNLLIWRARRDCSRLRRSSSASLRTAAATRRRPTWPKDGQVVELALFVCREFELKRRAAGVGWRSQIR